MIGAAWQNKKTGETLEELLSAVPNNSVPVYVTGRDFTLVDNGTTKTYFATSNWLANTGFDVGKLDNLKYMDKSDAKKFISNLGANLVVCDFKKSLVYMVQVTGCVYATWEAMSKEAQPSKVTRLVYDLDRLDNKDAKNAATLYLSSSNIGK